MTQNVHHFQSAAVSFSKFALPTIESSERFKSKYPSLDQILTLCDRMLASAKEDPRFNKIYKCGALLDKIFLNSSDTSEIYRACEELLSQWEGWLKFTLYLADPSKYTSSNTGDNFNLFAAVELLGLLDRTENDCPDDQIAQISDPVNRRIRMARHDRNKTTHGTSDIPETVRHEFICNVITSFISPIIIHYKKLQTSLSGLILSPISADKNTEVLLALNAEVRQGLLDNFAGRHDWIDRLCERLNSTSAGESSYLLLVAGEGVGKSALCARLSQELFSQSSPSGPFATTTLRHAPWLTGTLLHLGKTTNNPAEIVGSLVAQANALLLNPVPTNVYTQDNHDFSPSLGGRNTPIQIGNAGGIQETDRRYIEDHVMAANARINAAGRPPFEAESQFHRRILYTALERLVNERGKAVVIVDALDEISPDGTDLDFLPAPLPRNVSFLITARADSSLLTWLESNRRVEKLSLDYLERKEIPLITSVPDDEGSLGQKFNDRVWESSNGWALMVAHAAKGVREKGDFRDVEVEGNLNSILTSQAAQWMSGGKGDRILEELLVLLAIFEPASPIDLDSIQSYLASTGTRLNSIRIRQILQPVSSQLEGLSVGNVKLGLKVFADYIRNTFCSKQDIRFGLEKIRDWLLTDATENSKLISSLLSSWINPKIANDPQCIKLAEGFIDKLVAENDPEALFTIGKRILNRGSNEAELGLRYVREAARLGNSNAMGLLGEILLDGKYGACEAEEGHRLLQASADAGNLTAKSRLGVRLIDGDGLPVDKELGLKFLTDAADEGLIQAVASLGVRKLFGTGIDADPDQGWRLLEKAAEADFAPALFTIGRESIVNLGRVNIELAFSSLLRSAELGYTPAMRELGIRKIEGKYFSKDIPDGYRWLREAADDGDVHAILELGRFLIWHPSTPDELPQDIVNREAEGVEWLTRGAEQNNGPCMYYLAIHLDKDNETTFKLDNGLHWMERAAAVDFKPAKHELSLHYLKQENEEIVEKGRILLTENATAGYTPSMASLGERLMEGKVIEADTTKGYNLLKAGAEKGSAFANLQLGRRLLIGDGLPQDVDRGKEHLIRAAEKGNLSAKKLLVDHFIYTENIHPDDPQVTKWSSTIVDSDAEINEMLGFAFYQRREFVRAADSFRASAELGRDISKNNLAYMIRRGEVTRKTDLEAPSELLKPLIATKFPFAIINRALCLAQGIDCSPNIKAASSVFALLKDSSPEEIGKSCEWWESILLTGDAEGAFVLAWIHKTGLFPASMNTEYKRWYEVARDAGWPMDLLPLP